MRSSSCGREANGATWLDRQLVGRTPASLSAAGFGGEVHAAIEARVEHLVGQGLAHRQANEPSSYAICSTPCGNELEATAARIA
jgi:hypothetical protein